MINADKTKTMVIEKRKEHGRRLGAEFGGTENKFRGPNFQMTFFRKKFPFYRPKFMTTFFLVS